MYSTCLFRRADGVPGRQRTNYSMSRVISSSKFVVCFVSDRCCFSAIVGSTLVKIDEFHKILNLFSYICFVTNGRVVVIGEDDHATSRELVLIARRNSVVA